MTTRFCFPKSRGFISFRRPRCGVFRVTTPAGPVKRYSFHDTTWSSEGFSLNEIRRDTWSPADNGCRNIYGKGSPILINYPVTRVFVTRPVNTADLSSWADESDPFFLPQAENKPPPPPPPSPLVACTLLYYARNRIGREIPDER